MEKEKTSHYKPRGLRWSGLKLEEEGKAMSKVTDLEKSYSFWPYSYTRPKSYTDSILCRVERRGLAGASSIPPGTYFLLAIIALAHLPLKLEGDESTMSYNPIGAFDSLASTRGPYWS